MDVCYRCAEMGCSDNCDNCSYGNPCLGCEHYNIDCEGQCYTKEVEDGTNTLSE